VLLSNPNPNLNPTSVLNSWLHLRLGMWLNYAHVLEKSPTC